FMNMVGIFAGAAVTQVLGKFKDIGNFGFGFAILSVIVLLALIVQLSFLRPKTIDYVGEQ
ncbi:MAG: MFS transporter, partial [Bacteroidetes bacterium]|nr:MFS transporter [Bacteroidota bacterium]